MTKPQYTTIPRLIGTIDYSEFTTINSTKYKTFSGLKRNAKNRTFVIANTLDQPTSSNPNFTFGDSLMVTGGFNNGFSSASIIGSNCQLVETGERLQILNSHVDSVQIGFGMGATLPLSGKISIYVVEEF